MDSSAPWVVPMALLPVLGGSASARLPGSDSYASPSFRVNPEKWGPRAYLSTPSPVASQAADELRSQRNGGPTRYARKWATLCVGSLTRVAPWTCPGCRLDRAPLCPSCARSQGSPHRDGLRALRPASRPKRALRHHGGPRPGSLARVLRTNQTTLP